jgi:signal transduction histidine kinase
MEAGLSLQINDLPKARHLIDKVLLEVLARPVAVRQIAANLVHNALDAIAGRVDAATTVSAGLRDDQVWLRVVDDGPGVPEEARERIFDAWYTTKGQQGTGLGLYLARELVRADGGELILEEAGAGGANFLVTWPAYRE